jgi:hypothetical protein
MALLSFRGFDTPSLQAQGEQRRSSFFNIGRDIPIPPAETGYAFLLEDILVNNAPVKPQIGVTIFNGLYLASCEFALDKFFVWAGAFTSFQDRLAAESFGWHVLMLSGASVHMLKRTSILLMTAGILP